MKEPDWPIKETNKLVKARELNASGLTWKQVMVAVPQKDQDLLVSSKFTIKTICKKMCKHYSKKMTKKKLKNNRKWLKRWANHHFSNSQLCSINLSHTMYHNITLHKNPYIKTEIHLLPHSKVFTLNQWVLTLIIINSTLHISDKYDLNDTYLTNNTN